MKFNLWMSAAAAVTLLAAATGCNGTNPANTAGDAARTTGNAAGNAVRTAGNAAGNVARTTGRAAGDVVGAAGDVVQRGTNALGDVVGNGVRRGANGVGNATAPNDYGNGARRGLNDPGADAGAANAPGTNPTPGFGNYRRNDISTTPSLDVNNRTRTVSLRFSNTSAATTDWRTNGAATNTPGTTNGWTNRPGTNAAGTTNGWANRAGTAAGTTNGWANGAGTAAGTTDGWANRAGTAAGTTNGGANGAGTVSGRQDFTLTIPTGWTLRVSNIDPTYNHVSIGIMPYATAVSASGTMTPSVTFTTPGRYHVVAQSPGQPRNVVGTVSVGSATSSVHLSFGQTAR